jgi:hypothetical protein
MNESWLTNIIYCKRRRPCVRGNVDVRQIDARCARTIFEPSIKVNRTLYDLLLLKLLTGPMNLGAMR